MIEVKKLKHKCFKISWLAMSVKFRKDKKGVVSTIVRKRLMLFFETFVKKTDQ